MDTKLKKKKKSRNQVIPFKLVNELANKISCGVARLINLTRHKHGHTIRNNKCHIYIYY